MDNLVIEIKKENPGHDDLILGVLGKFPSASVELISALTSLEKRTICERLNQLSKFGQVRIVACRRQTFWQKKGEQK